MYSMELETATVKVQWSGHSLLLLLELQLKRSQLRLRLSKTSTHTRVHERTADSFFLRESDETVDTWRSGNDEQCGGNPTSRSPLGIWAAGR